MTIALVNAYRQVEDYFFRGISLKCLNLGDGVTAYMTGVPVADLNLVYIQNDNNPLDKLLINSNRFFDQDSLDFVVIIPEKCCTPEMQNILKTMDFPQTGKSVSMALKLEDLITKAATSLSDCLSIHANDNKLNEWMMPLDGAFESTFEISSQYANIHKNALKKKLKLQHFSLYIQGKPIASITLSLHDTIARIDDVGTLPEFQGKGYATRLMIHALSQAKEFGANYCFLEASDSGFSIYQKLGFQALFKNSIYSRKT